MSFSTFDLDTLLLERIRAQGYTEATPIQAAAIPLALAGRDVIGLAQTGTGKTAAFVLPILHQLMRGKRGGTRALIVTPTRELAEQINDTIIELGKGTGLRSATVYGGVGMDAQERALRNGVDIIVACPGRLLDHMNRGVARMNNLQVLVLDEADRMLDMGFLPDIRRILSHLPSQRQTMLFSATMPPEIKQLAAGTTRNAATVQIGQVVPANTVAHAIYPVEPHLKTPLLLELLRQADSGSILVFTRTKHRATRVAEQVARAGYTATCLHSNRSQNQRQAALDGFRDGRYRVLVATDIAARGIDVDRISHVINYDIPDTTDAYIHRIGRTGRATRTGDAFTLVTAEDTSTVRAIERVLGRPLERKTLADFDYAAPPPRNHAPSLPVGRGNNVPRPSNGRGPVAMNGSSTGPDGRHPGFASVTPGRFTPHRQGRGRRDGS